MSTVTVSNYWSFQCVVRTYAWYDPGRTYVNLYIIQPGEMNLVAEGPVDPNDPTRFNVQVNDGAAVLYEKGAHIDIGPVRRCLRL
jgi:hypothetical protein